MLLETGVHAVSASKQKRAAVLDVQGRKLFVEGLNAVDGSPVLDIKPWVVEFAPRGTITQPMWITELMKGYWSS
jgi:tRNA (adenine37-N6)-methyltransferase